MKVISSKASLEGTRELSVKELPEDAGRFATSQSAPNVYVVSGLGCWLFNQNDTDVLVQELRDLADMLDRSVAR